MRIIPTVVVSTDWVQVTQLDGTDYTLTFSWNAVDESWYLQLSDVQELAITGALKLVSDYPLLQATSNPARPPGEIMVIDQTGVGGKPAYAELGARYVLAYFGARTA